MSAQAVVRPRLAAPLESPESFHLAAGEPGSVLVLDVQYELHPPLLHWLPVVGHSPRYMLYVTGSRTRTPIALKPYANRMLVPILPASGKQPYCFAVVRSLVGGEWALKGVRARRLPKDVAKRYIDMVE